jgi:hypothetical protein
MARPKNEKSSADVTAEIRRLEQEKRRLIASEDQRRGALIREHLAGPIGERLRSVLGSFITPRDAFLFQLTLGETDASGPAQSGASGQIRRQRVTSRTPEAGKQPAPPVAPNAA